MRNGARSGLELRKLLDGTLGNEGPLPSPLLSRPVSAKQAEGSLQGEPSWGKQPGGGGNDSPGVFGIHMGPQQVTLAGALTQNVVKQGESQRLVKGPMILGVEGGALVPQLA